MSKLLKIAVVVAMMFVFGVRLLLVKSIEQKFRGEMRAIESDFAKAASTHYERVLTRLERDWVLEEIATRRDLLLVRYNKEMVGEWAVVADGAHFNCCYVLRRRSACRAPTGARQEMFDCYYIK